MAANLRVDHLELVRRNIAFIEQNIAAGGLATVAGYLLQFKLITRQNRDDALASSGKGPVDQAAMLMRMVELKIESDPDLYFPKFTEALRKSNLNNVADKLEQPATASLEHQGKRTYTPQECDNTAAMMVAAHEQIDKGNKVSRPTMGDLISMDMRDGSEGRLKIIEGITSHDKEECADFAYKLLGDRMALKKLRNTHHSENAFVRAVLEKWISRDDDDKSEKSRECTWEALVSCCHDANLEGDFVKLLRENVPK